LELKILKKILVLHIFSVLIFNQIKPSILANHKNIQSELFAYRIFSQYNGLDCLLTLNFGTLLQIKHMEDIIINKVAESGIITIDLEDFYPKKEIIGIDIKQWLFMEMLLKEKPFRQSLKENDWTIYQGKLVAIYCSTDAIIPRWAYMLLATYLTPLAAETYIGTPDQMAMHLILRQVQDLDLTPYQDKRIILKGCGKKDVNEAVYFTMTRRLLPHVQSIMYGEACSSVPVYKRKKT